MKYFVSSFILLYLPYDHEFMREIMVLYMLSCRLVLVWYSHEPQCHQPLLSVSVIGQVVVELDG